jgi:phosphonate transport system ATP-binding protein
LSLALAEAPARGAEAVPAVLARGLAKRFGDGAPVLAGVDLEVARGSAVALIGANGTGKSTLARMLVRLVEPDAGRIRLFGEEITTLTARRLARMRARVGFVFQKHNLVARLSALSNVVHGAQSRLSGPRVWHQALATRAVREEALSCLDRVGLAHKALARVDTLSGGQAQRVAIARMLMQRAELVIADEPDASLDPKAGEEVMALLAALTRDSGATLVFVSHRMEHARLFAQRIVGLRAGGIALDAPAASLSEAELVEFFHV